MASYRITALPAATPAISELRGIVQARSAFEQEEHLRHGTLPDTFASTEDDLCWFKYGVERESEKDTLEGKETTIIANKYTIIFLGNGYAAYEYCTQEVEEELLSIIGSSFEKDIRVEYIDFDEKMLRKVINQSETVSKVDVAPSQREEPDLVSGRDRKDLQQTKWWDQNTSEPFEKIKVDLPTEDVDFDVGFDDHGKVILYGRDIGPKLEAEILQYVTSEVINKIVDLDTFQSNNWF